jgi:hypothetical protein
MEDGKLTRRSVHSGATRAGKHDGNGVVRGRGRPVPGLGSIRATLGSSRRWRLGRRSLQTCCPRDRADGGCPKKTAAVGLLRGPPRHGTGLGKVDSGACVGHGGWAHMAALA